MNNLTAWNYEESVKKIRPMVMNWRNLTVEIVEELYMARKELSKPGARNDLVPNGTKTWESYLDDVGLARRTVHRWLERYEPTENRLMEPEEVEERKQIEQRKKQDEATAIQKRIIEYKQTGKMPEDWDDKTEREYRKQIEEDEKRTQRIEEAKKRMQEELDRRDREKKEREESRRASQKERDNFNDFLSQAAESALNNHKKRQEFKAKIKVSQSGESDLFIDALMDYLEELEDDNRRIEACQNIIKVCRNYAAELQSVRN